MFFDIHPCSALRDLQSLRVPPLPNEFCLIRGVDRQSHVYGVQNHGSTAVHVSAVMLSIGRLGVPAFSV